MIIITTIIIMMMVMMMMIMIIMMMITIIIRRKRRMIMMMIRMIMMMMMMILLLLLLLVFKGAIPGFLQSPHCAANCLQHVGSSGPVAMRVQNTCNTSNAYCVQHVVLRATWYKGIAQLLSLTELKSHLFVLYFIV